MELEYASISQRGKRSRNEDSFFTLDIQDRNRWMGIICDGMGGHTKGDVASQFVIKYISDYWESHIQEPDSEEKIKKACKKTSIAFTEKVFELNHVQMGTTMVMASIENDLLTIAHLGDSRCYYLDSSNHLLYQTQDHVSSQYGFERITRCFFSYHPEAVNPEVKQFHIKDGDRIFLCSDGVNKYMAPSTLLSILSKDESAKEILEELGNICETVSQDNYTAILLKVHQA